MSDINQETSLPRLSSSSTEDSLGRESFSSQSDSNRHGNLIIGRQESIDSRSSASCGSYCFCESPKSYNSPYNLMILGSEKNAQNQKDDFKQFSHDNTASVQLSASSRNSLQARDILRTNCRGHDVGTKCSINKLQKKNGKAIKTRIQLQFQCI